MMDTYKIRFFKNSSRIAPRALNVVDARLFYHHLKLVILNYEKRYGEKLNDASILIVIDGKNIYRKQSRLESMGIETVEDIMEYLDTEPKYIIANNVLVTDTSMKISGIYVLQLYSSWLYLNVEGEL